MKNVKSFRIQRGAALATVLLVAGAAAQAAGKSKEAAHMKLPAPSGAVILFDGKSTDAWNNPWKVQDGAIVNSGGDTVTKESFEDAYIHVEFRVPPMPEAKGQAKGNSGVYIQSRYEVQVLDSFGIDRPGKGDCGAIYNQSAPLSNPTKPAGEWQTYDIIFRAARFNSEGTKTAPARVTVLLNGVVIQNNTEIPEPSGGAQGSDESKPGPLRLQDHGNPVAFRNIWVVPLRLQGSSEY